MAWCTPGKGHCPIGTECREAPWADGSAPRTGPPRVVPGLNPATGFALSVAGAASPLAERIGSANSLTSRGGVWEAESTDPEGLLGTLMACVAQMLLGASTVEGLGRDEGLLERLAQKPQTPRSVDAARWDLLRAWLF